jgi:hypothetical protein
MQFNTRITYYAKKDRRIKRYVIIRRSNRCDGVYIPEVAADNDKFNKLIASYSGEIYKTYCLSFPTRDLAEQFLNNNKKELADHFDDKI